MSNWVKLTDADTPHTEVWINLDLVWKVSRVNDATILVCVDDHWLVKETPEEILRDQMPAERSAIPPKLDDWRPKCHPADGNWTTSVQGTSLRLICSVCGGPGI
jgi:hypothetical protein